MAAMGQFNATGKTGDLDAFATVAGDVKTLTDDAAIAAKTANAALQSLKNTWDAFADAQLAEPIQQAADALNRIGPEKMMEVLNTAKNVAMVLGGVVLASKAIGVAANARALFGKKPGGIGGAGGGIPGLGGVKLPLPVYVVNRRMSLTREAMLGGAGVGGKAAQTGKGGRASALGRRAGGAAAAGLAAFDAARVLMDDEATLADKAAGVASAGGQALGGWGGAALGAKMGAAIGTAIAPGVGTAIGAAIGGVGGGLSGAMGADWLVKSIGDFFRADAAPQKLEDGLRALGNAYQGALTDSTIRVVVEGPATATLAQNNGPANVDVYSGMSYSAGLSD